MFALWSKARETPDPCHSDAPRPPTRYCHASITCFRPWCLPHVNYHRVEEPSDAHQPSASYRLTLVALLEKQEISIRQSADLLPTKSYREPNKHGIQAMGTKCHAYSVRDDQSCCRKSSGSRLKRKDIPTTSEVIAPFVYEQTIQRLRAQNQYDPLKMPGYSQNLLRD